MKGANSSIAVQRMKAEATRSCAGRLTAAVWPSSKLQVEAHVAGTDLIFVFNLDAVGSLSRC